MALLVLLLLTRCASPSSPRGASGESPTIAPASDRPAAGSRARDDADPGAPAPAPGPEPLTAWPWTDVPARVHALEGQVFASHERGLALVRDDRLVQDGVIARIPECARDPEAVGAVAGLAGTWPHQTFQLRKATDAYVLFRWEDPRKDPRWREVRRVDRARAWLVTRAGAPLLVSTEGASLGRVRIEGLGSTDKAPRPAPGAADDCPTAIADPAGVVANARGDLVVWGRGCAGEGVVEIFGAEGPGRLSSFEGFEVTAASVSASGQVLAARVAGTTGAAELLASTGEGWEPRPAPPGRVVSLAPGETLLAVVAVPEDPSRRVLVELRGSAWRERTLPASAGEPIAVATAHDGSPWITTERALWRTRPPAHAADWWRGGCEVATVRDAPDHRPRGARSGPGRCPGGLFLLIQTTDGVVPPAWQRLYRSMPQQVEQGYRVARARRPEPDAAPIEPQPSYPFTPVVAPELGSVHYGFFIRDGRDQEQWMLDLRARATEQAEGEPRPKLLCADPIGLPEPRVRALAGE